MEKPLTREDLKYVDQFRKTRDVTKAGASIGLGSRNAKRMHERIEIQEEIERQDMVVMQERAKIQVAEENLSNDLLDRELMKLILLDAKDQPDAKRRSIELGYVLTGRIQMGNTKSLDLAPPTGDDTPLPTVYQAFIPVGVPVEIAPILPTPAPPPTSDDALRQRVRELTTPKSEPVEAPKSNGRFKII